MHRLFFLPGTAFSSWQPGMFLLTIQDFKHHFFVISLPDPLLSVPTALAPPSPRPSPQPPVNSQHDPTPRDDPFSPSLAHSPPVPMPLPQHPQAKSQPLRLIILECIHLLCHSKQGSINSFMASPCWRPRDESAMSPALREARETDTQKKNTQLSPLQPLPLPCPPKAQRQNKGAIVQRRQSPERQAVAGWASWAGGQLDERLGVAAQEMWLGTGGCNG